MLHRWLTEQNLVRYRKLAITADNHSTNKCNTMLAYLFYLVRNRGVFQEIEVIFPPAGHTKDRLDQAHSSASKSFASNQVDSISQLETYLSPSSRYTTKYMPVHWDWDAFFEPHLHKFKDISKPHMFRITAEGVRSRLWAADEWSQWEGQACPAEPTVMLDTRIDRDQLPSARKPEKLCENRRKEILSAVQSAGTSAADKEWISKLISSDPNEIGASAAVIESVPPPPHPASSIPPAISHPPPKPPAAPTKENIVAILEHQGESAHDLQYYVEWESDHSKTWIPRSNLRANILLKRYGKDNNLPRQASKRGRTTGASRQHSAKQCTNSQLPEPAPADP